MSLYNQDGASFYALPTNPLKSLHLLLLHCKSKLHSRRAMANSSLAVQVVSLEAEMAIYYEEIEQLSAQIARLISTIRTLLCV
ncbi:hypothetical protein RHMOL_Rhmol08G0198100 [Rhododendron molle]|uniref:Uncharacterized protein n=1 Tax=Rhododendron molle TaxID=49168 RepID=A0ACC0MQ54_RHOML|nr:hypothetical protein RHMOL_Rhmol08G0198100 [Rhododendron molle]